MNETGKRIEGAAQEAGGKVKTAVGQATGDRKLELEGKGTELKGEIKQEAAKGSHGIRSKFDELAGKVKEKLDHLKSSDKSH